MKWLAVLFLILIACAQRPVEQKEIPASQELAKEEAVGLSDAAKLGKPIKCTSEHEGQATTIYMKGSQMRMDTMPADAHGIYTSDVMYTWKGSEGMMIKMDEMKKLAAEHGESFTPPSQEEIVAKAEQENAKCESFDVPESMFVPPDNVKFEDFGELMKQIEATTKNLQK